MKQTLLIVLLSISTAAAAEPQTSDAQETVF